MKTAPLRHAFLSFFERHGHQILPSGSLIPHHDPSLLFTNAGMVPFKDIFTGNEKPIFPMVTTAQKCVRAGGKHNDLENVGYTARHHTFFEMLGNFSFGSYFKERAIELAWALLTQEFLLDPKRLYVTYYAEDAETPLLWKKIAGLSSSHLIGISTQDNFWAMGNTGPCGPCSEIFYDHGDHVQGGLPGTAEADGDRYVEIWNLVFMQFNQLLDGERSLLPHPSIDTGMGIERIAAVLQGTFDNYATDIMQALISTSASLTHTDPSQVSHRVIADHLRSSCFLIADGVLPSNEGRGYVLRRIMRRAMRHAHLLGAKDPLLCQLVPELVMQMGEAYPELGRAEALIAETLFQEENRFRETLDRGLRVLDEEVDLLSQNQTFSGKIAFKLYDTYGFPLDLTQDILRGQRRQVDEDEFHHEMEKQKARSSWMGSGEEKTSPLWRELTQELGETLFIGNEVHESESKISALVCNQESVHILKSGSEGWLIVPQTPFYAEGGGQVGDTGWILAPGLSVEVLDTQKYGVTAHRVRVKEGMLTLGQTIILSIDVERRHAIRANHSATHLLDAALRRRFGPSVVQKGSLVTPDKLRFDFSLSHSLSSGDLLALEKEVNKQIRANVLTHIALMPLIDAFDQGAIGIFGEKYGEEVRVVGIGILDDLPYSKELCGGVHVVATGEIGFFKIVGESSLAAGVRRVEAVTGAIAEIYVTERLGWLAKAAETLKTRPQDVVEKINAGLDEQKKQAKDFAALRQKNIGGEREVIGTVTLLTQTLQEIIVKELRTLVDRAKQSLNSGIVMFCSVSAEGTVTALIGVTPDLVDRFPATMLIQSVAPLLGGKGGGGRPDLAQCGGNDSQSIPSAVAELREMIKVHF